MKDKIKKKFPVSILVALFLEYTKDYGRYIKYSGVFAFISDSEEKALGNIIADYHVVEKGLTMPETRLGFGEKKISKLMDHCDHYLKNYNKKNTQFLQAIAILVEYKEFHKKQGYQLNKNLLERINSLEQSVLVECSKQVKTSASEYFIHSKASFDLFSKSRRSVRNYANTEVDKNGILNAVELATRSPSSCNRQATRVHVFENKDEIKQILEIQGGNRGFGHLANKLLIVTADLAYCHGVYERNMAYVDGGIFAMNLLNGLHFNKILACPLNCYFSRWKDKKLRKICKIKKSEVFVVMVSCGNPIEKFDVALSYRSPVEEIVSFK